LWEPAPFTKNTFVGIILGKNDIENSI